MKKHHLQEVSCHSGNAVYGLGMLGALVYFFQNATSFGDGLLGILKALLWPAFLIHRVLEVLNF